MNLACRDAVPLPHWHGSTFPDIQTRWASRQKGRGSGWDNRNHGPFKRLSTSLLHEDVWLGRIGHANADVESRVRRLVVAGILKRDLRPVGRIVH